MPEQPHDNWEEIEHEDFDVDSDIYLSPPETDIDQYVQDCNFRIERLGEDGLWVCAYTHDPDEPDHHYRIRAEEDGLHITYERDYRRDDDDQETQPAKRPSEIRGDLATETGEEEEQATEMLREERERDKTNLDKQHEQSENDT
jgi:hypothetical protein